MANSYLPFIRSGQYHLARHSERGKKTRQTEEEVGRQHSEMDRPEVRQVPEGSGEQVKMEETGCEIICGAPTTHEVKGRRDESSHLSTMNDVSVLNAALKVKPRNLKLSVDLNREIKKLKN